MFKLENGVLIQSPQTIQFVKDGYFYSYTNPSDEILKELGWKPIKETEKPEIAENQHLETTYEEHTKYIKVIYSVVDNEEII